MYRITEAVDEVCKLHIFRNKHVSVVIENRWILFSTPKINNRVTIAIRWSWNSFDLIIRNYHKWIARKKLFECQIHDHNYLAITQSRDSAELNRILIKTIWSLPLNSDFQFHLWTSRVLKNRWTFLAYELFSSWFFWKFDLIVLNIGCGNQFAIAHDLRRRKLFICESHPSQPSPP